MSSQELHPFFPSATHPAIPVAAQILSTLRSLTAPGKGNDLRAEERAALVGVSALLGCERVQSNDLIESSAQRLASVAPAHFKSALAASRRLLASSETRTRSRTASTSSASTQTASSPIAERSPFSTPKKKFKYSSGVDLSGLLTPHRHSPATASPLRASVTPSKRRRESMPGIDEDEEDEEEEDAGERTPTKKKTKTPTLQEKLAAARKDKEREGAAAFLALRPGSSAPAAETTPKYDPLVSLGLGRDAAGEVVPMRIRKIAKRNDWTFRERVWTRSEVDVWDIIGKPLVPQVIVTDDEDEDEPEQRRTTPRSKKQTPKKTTPKTKRTPKKTGTLDAVIVAAWA